MTGILDWNHAVQDIPERGPRSPLTVTREATPEERGEVARELELLDCSRLAATYTVTVSGGGRYKLAGRLKASLQQRCVVTLEPLAAVIDEPFEADFWPESEMPATDSGEIDIEDESDVEPIVARRIDVGRVVYECLAGAVDPFPRKPGAELEHRAAAPDGSNGAARESPFAVLARIKEKD